MLAVLRLSLLILLPATVAANQTPEPDVLVSSAGKHVVVNLPQTRAFLYEDGQLIGSYPVAVGKMITNTPTGNYAITGIYRNPVWHVPKSIQEEMARQGKPVQTTVPAGPGNPLGPVFIRFGEPRLGLGFHGTTQPGSVPGFRSHGCVRLRNENAVALSNWVTMGAAVTISYQSILLHEDEQGDLWLHAYRDAYQRKDLQAEKLAATLLEWQANRQRAVFGKRVDEALRLRNGKATCLTCTDKVGTASGRLVPLRWLSPPQEAQLESSAASVITPRKRPVSQIVEKTLDANFPAR